METGVAKNFNENSTLFNGETSPAVRLPMEPVEREEVLFSVDEVPPWYTCIFLGFQHYLTAFGSQFTLPLVMAHTLCMSSDLLGISNLLGTVFFISGLSTLLQTTLGCRLPIVQGGSFSFVVPAMTLFSLPKWHCPYHNLTANMSDLPDVGSADHREMWESRLREGCLIVGSLFQVFIGFSGLLEFFLQFIGPLVIAPTISLIGLSLFQMAANKSSSFWWMAFLAIAVITISSQYLQRFNIPCYGYTKARGCVQFSSFPLFKLFPVLFAILFPWLVCFILTILGALPSDKGAWGYEVRTDIKTDVLYTSSWFRFPYPGQWGVPTVSVAGVLGILAGILVSIIESIGDYYACAKLSGAAPPPVHAINRGIGVEGITCILAGAWGSASGTTSYSENIGAIGITKVGSRRVVQVGAVIMIFLGCFGKFGALFMTVPDPVIGGLFLSMFGMVTAVGLSNLQYVKLNSSRNVFILGSSLYIGLAFPNWMSQHTSDIKTGSSTLDQIIAVLLGTGMFVGGFIACLLDNTIPGTDEERGLAYWKSLRSEGSPGTINVSADTYSIPLIQNHLNKIKCMKYMPFCPSYIGLIKMLSSWCNCKKKPPAPVESLSEPAAADFTKL